MGDSAGDGDEYGDGSPRVGMEEQKDSDLGSFAHQPRFRFRLQNISLKWASQVVKENGIFSYKISLSYIVVSSIT